MPPYRAPRGRQDRAASSVNVSFACCKVFQYSYLNSTYQRNREPPVSYEGYHTTDVITVIEGVALGGTSLFGGIGTVSGTVVGILIPTTLSAGLVIANVQPFWQYIVVGIIVILAVLIDQARDLIVGRMESG